MSNELKDGITAGIALAVLVFLCLWAINPDSYQFR